MMILRSNGTCEAKTNGHVDMVRSPSEWTLTTSTRWYMILHHSDSILLDRPLGRNLILNFNEVETNLRWSDTQLKSFLVKVLPGHILNILNKTSTAKEIGIMWSCLCKGSGRDSYNPKEEDLFV
ncbi:hypothetical protein Tco_0392437 [Tanacetum coccineum]